MKKLFLSSVLISMTIWMYAQDFVESFTETFDANSLNWTESAGESSSGTAIIDKGVMTIKSKGDTKFTRFMAKANGDSKGFENTAFETHCYAPLDVRKPFEIIANVKMDNLDLERQAGLIFNYRDFGNYYVFVFNKESVSFIRFADNRCVGSITQDVKWGKADNGKQYQVWKLISENGELQFLINGMEILKVRYMPLDFTGVGFYTLGKQTLVVEDITFTQGITDAGMHSSLFSDSNIDISEGSLKSTPTTHISQYRTSTEGKGHYMLIYRKKKKTAQAWTIEKQETLYTTYSRAKEIAEEWNSHSSNNYDYKCSIKEEN